jgi:hypothetical protein
MVASSKKSCVYLPHNSIILWSGLGGTAVDRGSGRFVLGLSTFGSWETLDQGA